MADMERPDVEELTVPDRLLMGPGPSMVHPRVLRAMATPMLGYLDPAYVGLMDDVGDLLRYVFQTDNRWTIAVSGTGSAAMETAMGNVVRPGDTVLVPSNGYFGLRLGAMADRAGAEVVTVDAPWGEPLDAAAVDEAFATHQPEVFAFVHGETSTGVRQPVPDVVEVAHDYGGLVVVDTVATLGGVPFHADKWNVDIAYSGAQKCLSAPPGASPLTVSDNALEHIRNRQSPVQSWYLDLRGVLEYWDDDPSYHHTGPIANTYALREALRLTTEEGLETRWARHERVAGALRAGLGALGLEPVVDEAYWLPSLTTVSLPEGVEDGAVTESLLDRHGIEVAGGLGALAGDVLRVGCMGYSAQPGAVLETVAALGDVLHDHADVTPDKGLAATRAALQED